MKTDTRSWVPIVPCIEAGLEGQEVAPDGIMQTVPMVCPWAGAVAGTRNIVPRSTRIAENNNLVLVKTGTCFQAAQDMRLRLKLSGSTRVQSDLTIAIAC
jgi:hypothetical protein